MDNVQIDKKYILNHIDFFITQSVKEAIADKTCLRSNIIAAVLLFSCVDYIELVDKKKALAVRENRKIKVLRSVANAFKHGFVDKYNPLINCIDQVQQKDHPGLFGAPFGQGYFAEASYVRISSDKLEYSEIFLSDIIQDSYNIIISAINELD